MWLSGGDGVVIRLQHQLSMRSVDLELVTGPLTDAADVALPDARVAQRPQRVDPPVPLVPVADHRDAARVGRPDGEVDGVVVDTVGAELLPDALVPSLAEEMQVEGPEDRGRGGGVGHEESSLVRWK